MRTIIMRTIFICLLSFTLLMTLNGMAKAEPPTNIVGSWSCEVGTPNAFLVSFCQGGAFTATDTTASTSLNHGSWKRTGLNTFSSTDLAFIYDSGGNAEFIQTTDADITMSDNDNLTADLEVTITELDGTVVDTVTATTTCERIQVNN